MAFSIIELRNILWRRKASFFTYAVGLFFLYPLWELHLITMEGAKEDGNCVILHYDPPLPHEIHPQCFLQKYCLKYNVQPQNICRPNTEVNLFVFIFSLSSSFQRRQLIRKTWTNRTYFAKHDFRYVFLLGHEGSHADGKIYQEAEKYDDIVVIDIKDHFCHLTLKGVAGLYIAKSLCPQARFVMKTDDDIFVNMFLLQKMLRNMVNSGQTTKVLMGLVHKLTPFTLRKGKYAVSKLQYPHVFYPAFCSGSGFIMSMDVDKSLYQLAMKDTRKVILHLDDPYITGILAHRAGLKHIQIEDMYNYDGTLYFYQHLSSDELKRYLILHIQGGTNTNILSSSQLVHINLWDRLVQLYIEPN